MNETLTLQEVKAEVTESARAQLSCIAELLAGAGIEIESLARAIGSSAATKLGLKLGLISTED